jgi:hypothetical protein
MGQIELDRSRGANGLEPVFFVDPHFPTCYSSTQSSSCKGVNTKVVEEISFFTAKFKWGKMVEKRGSIRIPKSSKNTAA